MKYQLINRNNEKIMFNTINEIENILNEFDCTKLGEYDICFLQNFMEIEKKDNFDRLIWKIKRIK